MAVTTAFWQIVVPILNGKYFSSASVFKILSHAILYVCDHSLGENSLNSGCCMYTVSSITSIQNHLGYSVN